MRALPGAAAMSAHGSNKRKRTRVLSARFNDQEAAAVRSMADKRGESVGTLLRSTLLGVPPPPRSVRKPPVESESVAKLLAEFQKIRAELGKSGSNLNQLTHYAHLDRYQPGSIAVAVEEHRECIRTIEEMRLWCMQALGAERNRRPRD
jgi:hypothetical protein